MVYYDRAVAAMRTGKPRGWYACREIEWLEFPRYLTEQPGEQDLGAIQSALAAVGQILLVLASNSLRLEAYLAVAALAFCTTAFACIQRPDRRGRTFVA